MTDSDSTAASFVLMASKHCPCCKQQLPASKFHKNRRSLDGLQGFCIACAKQARKRPDEARSSQTRAIRAYAAQSLRKPCSACLLEKPLQSEFWTKSGRGLGGFSSRCKDCDKKRRDAKKSPELVARQIDAANLQNLAMKRCPKCGDAKVFSCFVQRKNGGHYSYCLECCKAQSNEQRLADIDKDRSKKLKSWRKRISENGDVMRQTRNVWRNEKRKTDPVFAISERMRSLLLSALKRKGFTKRSRTYRAVGCTWLELVSHMERQFVRGMSWDNRDEWHIDHIVPMATATTEDEVLALNHFTNLRPIWAKDNLSKGAQITHLI